MFPRIGPDHAECEWCALSFVDIGAHSRVLVAGGIASEPVCRTASNSITTRTRTLRGAAARLGVSACKTNGSRDRKLTRHHSFPISHAGRGHAMHISPAKAYLLPEGGSGRFRGGFSAYAKQIVANARKLAAEFPQAGFRMGPGAARTIISS